MAMAGWNVGMVATGIGAIYRLIVAILLGFALPMGPPHVSPSPLT
jgi:hypothetical protein